MSLLKTKRTLALESESNLLADLAETILFIILSQYYLFIVSPRIVKLEGPSEVDEGSDVTLICLAKSHSLSKLNIRWERIVSLRHGNFCYIRFI